MDLPRFEKGKPDRLKTDATSKHYRALNTPKTLIGHHCIHKTRLVRQGDEITNCIGGVTKGK